MDKERFLKSGLLEQYVLGLTTEEESKEVERYAEAFPEVQVEINMLKKAMLDYAEKAIGMDVSSAKKGSSKISTTRQAKKARTGHSLTPWLVAASLLLFGILSIHYHGRLNKANEKIAQMSAQFQSLVESRQQDQQELQTLKSQVAFYQHHLTSPVKLQGKDLKVRVYWNEQIPSAVLHIVNMPNHPDDKQFQIWADLDGEMVDLGLINSNSEQPQTIRCLPKAKSLNITLEPEGGSEHPHVDQLYANAVLY